MKTLPIGARPWAAALLSTFWTLAPAAVAQEAEEAASREGAQYGRIQLVEGRISLVRAFDGERIPLEPNQPLVAGDRIETAETGRFEAGLSDASVLRARGPLELDFHSLASLDSGSSSTHVRLDRGDLSVEVSAVEQRPEVACQVETPAGTAYLMTDGLYRIRVDAEGRAIVWVRQGVAEVEGGRSTVLVRSGQSTQLVTGRAPTDPSSRVSQLDEFEVWVDARIAAVEEAPVQEEIVEDLPEPVQPYYGELSGYGRWQELPTYGWAWVPSVSVGWTPYYYGYWIGSPIGHVWVSYEPWGWAPYHYGRWHWHAGIGWAWIPGARFSGAWVQWYAGPSYLAWFPLGYYGGAAIDLHVVFASHYRYPRSGWSCVPYSQFYARDLSRRYVRDPRVFREHVQQAVPVRRLPGFRPHDVRTRPGFGAELYAEARRQRTGEASGRRFHAADLRARSATRAARTVQSSVGPSSAPLAPGPVNRRASPGRAAGTSARGETSHFVRTQTLDYQVRRSLPPATQVAPRPSPRGARGGVEAGSGQANATSRLRSQRHEQSIVDLLRGVPRRPQNNAPRLSSPGPQAQTPEPAAPRVTAPTPRSRSSQAVPAPRSQRRDSAPAPRGRGHRGSPPRQPRRH